MPKLLVDPPLVNCSGILSYPDVFERLENINYPFVKEAETVMGAWVTKSYTPRERPGNENVTVYELPGGAGLINSMGLPNPGVEYKDGERDPLEELAKAKLKKPLIVSVAGFQPNEYAEVIIAFEKRVPNAAAYELNLSCPNITPGEKSIAGSIGDSPDLVYQVVRNATKATRKPIIAKISPACPVKRIAKSAEEAGADYIGCANTMPGLILNKRGKPVLAGGSGGLSGRIVKPINLKVVYDVYETIDTKTTGIFAYGGIYDIYDIIDYCRAGAEVFGLGSVFRGMDSGSVTGHVHRLTEELKSLQLEKMRGSAHA
jgi:dihydroorotate dehydrogenase subfamily 1